MEYKDYYKILGVERGAREAEIKRAYRKLARKYHPDVSKEADAKSRFQEISEAYHVLKDAKRRAAYDQLGSGWQHGQEFHTPPGWEVHFGQGRAPFEEWGGAEASDFFRSIFGGWPFGGAREAAARRGADVDAVVRIDLEDSYAGNTIRLTVPVHHLDAHGNIQAKNSTFKVKIPRGITEGQQIRIAGHGAPGPGTAPPGDLYLTVKFAEHPLYAVRGRDVFLTLPIAPWEAALGTTLRVPTLGGQVELRIPAEAQTGTRLRLKGRGLPGPSPGDQFVTLKIVTPAASNDTVKELYRKLEQASRFNPRKTMGA
ncbi:MAG: cytochrome C biogenesis protein [Thiotrichales bacterium SG8_50]|nr:MAG: cytochrome C biogenesis protein [Thiotrichales bacterium SG8_50]